MADVVQVENLKETPLKIKYDSRVSVIPPKGKGLVETEAAIIWFGDWNSRNLGNDERSQFRLEELRRLRGIYGANFDDPRDDPRIPEPLTADEKWKRNAPQVRVFDDQGNRITTVLEDPEGKDLPLEGAATSDIGAVVDDLQRQVTELQSRLQQAQEVASTIEIPDDDPDKAPRRRRGPVAVDPVRGD